MFAPHSRGFVRHPPSSGADSAFVSAASAAVGRTEPAIAVVSFSPVRRVSLVHFTLYVAGDSPRSRAAEANLRRLCDDRLAGRCAVTVVDVTEAAERAERARILTTPTVVKEEPAPPRRVTGDLGDTERLWLFLGLDDAPHRHDHQ